MIVAPSLLQASGNPVLSGAADWLSGTLLGGIAITLCVIAVAFVGMMLMTGRLAVRDAMRVAIGCFVLLGAPVIATGLRGGADVAAGAMAGAPRFVEKSTLRPLPQSTYDPYAGASLKRD